MSRNGTHKSMAVLAAMVVTAAVIGACGGEEAVTTTAVVTADLTVQADTVTGPLNIPSDQSAGRVCVAQSRFARNSEVVWRVRVIDPLTGTQLDDTAIQTLQVKLADGQVLDMRYGDHPRDNPTDKFWTTSFDIPADYPTGTLGYEVVAVDTAGRTGNFVPFNVAPSLLTITDEVYETVEEGS